MLFSRCTFVRLIQFNETSRRPATFEPRLSSSRLRISRNACRNALVPLRDIIPESAREILSVESSRLIPESKSVNLTPRSGGNVSQMLLRAHAFSAYTFFETRGITFPVSDGKDTHLS